MERGKGNALSSTGRDWWNCSVRGGRLGIPGGALRQHYFPTLMTAEKIAATMMAE
jgi:hypothetical protein